MGGHRRGRGWLGAGHAGGMFPGQSVTGPLEGGPRAPRRVGPISWIAVVVGLLVWSLLAWTAYAFAESLIGWVAANAGLVVESGKNLATATGVGKEATSVVDGLNLGGLVGQALALLRVVVKPAIVVVWAMGVVALLAAPLILSRIGALLAPRHR